MASRAFVLTLFVSYLFTHPALLRTKRPVQQIIRSLLLVASIALNFLALRWLQLDEALFSRSRVPGFGGGMHPAAFISLAATICFGLYAVFTRIVSRVDSSQTSLFCANWVGAVGMLPIIP